MYIIKEFLSNKLKVKIAKTKEALEKVALQDVANKIVELLESKNEISVLFALSSSQSKFLEILFNFPNIDWKKVNVFHLKGYLKVPVDAQVKCLTYSEPPKAHPVDIVCMGLGEFNDVSTSSNIYCMISGMENDEAVFDMVRKSTSSSILKSHQNANLYTDTDSGKRILVRKAVITDEISQDFQEAIDLAVKYNLEAVEIRSVWEKSPHELDVADIERMKSILAKSGLKVCGISAPIFKCDMDSKEEIELQYDILNKSIQLAKELNAKFIRGFTFWAKSDFESDFCKIIPNFTRVIKILKKEDIVMALEFDPSVCATNAKKLVKVIEKINSPYVKALWDPGNDIYDPDHEVPYPDGYQLIKKHMVHMHLKDAHLNEQGKAEGVPLGKGDVDYIGQFKAVFEDGYDGYIVLETHYRPKHEISDDLMALPKGSSFSYLGYEATEECLIKWENLTQNVIDRMGGIK